MCVCVCQCVVFLLCFFFILFILFSLPVCFLKRERNKACSWPGGEVGRIWEEMREDNDDLNILCEQCIFNKK